MERKIQLLTAIEYFRDERPWRPLNTKNPSWEQIEFAIIRMENYCFPIVQLNCTEFEDDEDMLNIIGGSGRYAMFNMMGTWQYSDPSGTDEPVHLWESDQGYECQQRHIITDLAKVLRIARQFYETGSYSVLSMVA